MWIDTLGEEKVAAGDSSKNRRGGRLEQALRLWQGFRKKETVVKKVENSMFGVLIL